MSKKKEKHSFIPQVAKMLGVEIGERFVIVGCEKDNESFYFLNNGLYSTKKPGVYSRVLLKILRGEYTIGKKWKPKAGEVYFVPSVGSGTPRAWAFAWGYNNDLDEEYYKGGHAFQDKDAAEKKAAEIINLMRKIKTK